MANTNTIITTVSVFGTPKIIQSGTSAVTTFSKAQQTREINKYWKNVDANGDRRRLFPIEFWELDKIVKPNKDLALVVKNIDNPYKVTVKWLAYPPAKPVVLDNKSVCFVIPRSYYDGIITVLQLGTVSHFLGGLKKVNQSKTDSNFIVVLLGQDKNDNYTLYLSNASADLIGIPPASSWPTLPGGEGAGGVKLP